VRGVGGITPRDACGHRRTTEKCPAGGRRRALTVGRMRRIPAVIRRPARKVGRRRAAGLSAPARVSGL
jgi:hypothetical protein